jgi:CubicO group peptidase (beta-lactamase class C family)
LSHVRRVLEAEVAAGLFTRGAQVTATLDGRPFVDVAVGDDGIGRPLSTETVFRVYCTIKPLTAVAVAREVDEGRLDLDEPLAERLPGVAAVADGAVTLQHVLHHTAGLHRPTALEVELMPTARRRAHLDAFRRPPGWQVGRRAAYSELLGWHLLGRLLEQVTGQPLREHLRRSLLDPLGLASTWIGMTPAEHRAVLPRLGVNVDMSTTTAFPMVLERGERMCTEVNPAHGGYTTARDLARFYELLHVQLAGGEHPALPTAATLRRFTSSLGPPRLDEVLDRTCEYGLGFMTGLAGHAFGRWCSPSSFGHSGYAGSSLGFADPERGLAVGVIFNGVVDHQSAFVRRPALVRAIYEDLDEASPRAEAVEGERTGGERPGRRRFWQRSTVTGRRTGDVGGTG